MMIQLIPEPWCLASRVLAICLLLFGFYIFGRHDGAAHVEARWQADRPPRLAARRRPNASCASVRF